MDQLPVKFGPGGPFLTAVHFSWYTCITLGPTGVRTIWQCLFLVYAFFIFFLLNYTHLQEMIFRIDLTISR